MTLANRKLIQGRRARRARRRPVFYHAGVVLPRSPDDEPGVSKVELTCVHNHKTLVQALRCARRMTS